VRTKNSLFLKPAKILKEEIKNYFNTYSSMEMIPPKKMTAQPGELLLPLPLPRVFT
jgi:hypothetical protein